MPKMCPASWTFCHRCYSSLQVATQQVYQAAILRDGFQQNSTDRNCSFILHLGSQDCWSWSRLSWGEDGATSRQRISHTNACRNVWAEYQSALMCTVGGSRAAVEIAGRYREDMQTPRRQPEHPTKCLSKPICLWPINIYDTLKCFLIFPVFLKARRSFS